MQDYYLILFLSRHMGPFAHGVIFSLYPGHGIFYPTEKHVLYEATTSMTFLLIGTTRKQDGNKKLKQVNAIDPKQRLVLELQEQT